MKSYLVVDLDDTLIKTDCLWEQWLIAVKNKPLFLILSVFYLFRGPLFFKNKVADLTRFEPDNLPYRPAVLAIIKDRKFDKDLKVILATASPQAWADSVQEHLKIFDTVLGSTNSNLKGKKNSRQF